MPLSDEEKKAREIALTAERLELVDKLAAGDLLSETYEDIGLTMRRVAVERKRQLNAKKVSWQKIKGFLPPGLNLPPGYKVITPSQRVEVFDPESGVMLVADPGETLIQYVGPDHAVRLKAADAIERNRGWAGADKVDHQHKAAVIHLHHHIPEPLPLPEMFKTEKEDDVED